MIADIMRIETNCQFKMRDSFLRLPNKTQRIPEGHVCLREIRVEFDRSLRFRNAKIVRTRKIKQTERERMMAQRICLIEGYGTFCKLNNLSIFDFSGFSKTIE